MIPIVAVVGRPNVGKSTLFNRLTGKNLAIVHNAPGVTRDRHYAQAYVRGRELLLIDTGGFDPTSDDPMGQGIARHVQAAIEEADVVLCLLDGSGPPTEPDREAIDLLRRSARPVVYAANKVDTERREAEANALYELGVEHLIGISALHGRNLSRLETALVRALPPATPEPADLERPSDAVPRVALIGRPNAGKSSLFNRLAETERSLVDARPGTTRDPIDATIVAAGREFVMVDTAGIRRRTKVDRGVEAASVIRAIRAVSRADLALLMVDATEGVAEQDTRLFGLCLERGRGLVVGLNKVDLLSRAERKKAMEDAADKLRFATWAPTLPLSAHSGQGVPELMARVAQVADEHRRRIGTGELNRFFEAVLERHPPPTRGGRAPRIYFITQAESAPPVFVASTNAPDSIHESYTRFITNQIRKAFGFEGVPLVIRYKKRGVH